MAKSSRGRVPAAAPFAFRPPLVDPPHAKAALDSTLDLIPWAAYSLGYQIGRMPFAIQLARTAPQLGADCFDAIPCCASVIRQTCDLLGAVMPVGVASLIRGAVNELEAFNNAAAHTFSHSERFVWDVAVGNYLADRLPVLMRGALPSDSCLLPWLNIGHEIGDFTCRDPAHGGQAAVPFRPVVDAVRILPRAERNALREFREVAALIDRPEFEGEAGLRRAYVDRLAADWPFDELDPWPACPFFTREIEALHRRIDEHLLSRKADAPLQEADHVPRWDRNTGKLKFGGVVIREVAVQAKRVREGLDLFQKEEWPTCVETKFSDDPKKKLVKSMNKGLIVIEFYPGGSKNGIGWRLRTAR